MVNAVVRDDDTILGKQRKAADVGHVSNLEFARQERIFFERVKELQEEGARAANFKKTETPPEIVAYAPPATATEKFAILFSCDTDDEFDAQVQEILNSVEGSAEDKELWKQALQPLKPSNKQAFLDTLKTTPVPSAPPAEASDAVIPAPALTPVPSAPVADPEPVAARTHTPAPKPTSRNLELEDLLADLCIEYARIYKLDNRGLSLMVNVLLPVLTRNFSDDQRSRFMASFCGQQNRTAAVGLIRLMEDTVRAVKFNGFYRVFEEYQRAQRAHMHAQTQAPAPANGFSS